MKTSVVVRAESGTVSVASMGDIIINDLTNGDLHVIVVENDVEVKRFFFKSGKWDMYQIFKTESGVAETM